MKGSNFRHQAAAWAILMALALVCLGGTAPAWRSYQDVRTAIEGHQDRIVRNLEAAAQAEWLAKEFGDDAGAGTQAQYLLAGGSAVLAAAELQSRMEILIEESGGRLLSTQALEPEAEHGLIRVSVQVHLSATAETLARMLRQMEGQPPFLAIEEFSIAADSYMASDMPDLDIWFRASGWMEGDA